MKLREDGEKIASLDTRHRRGSMYDLESEVFQTLWRSGKQGHSLILLEVFVDLGLPMNKNGMICWIGRGVDVDREFHSSKLPLAATGGLTGTARVWSC